MIGCPSAVYPYLSQFSRYFFGHSLVQSEMSTSPVKYWDAPLYTAVPSR